MVKWVIGLFICSSSWAQIAHTENELLWEISGNGLKEKSYLFGSFHSNDKRLFRFSDSTFVALHRASAIALETDIFSLFDEWDTRKEAVSVLYDNTGKPYTNSKKASKTMYGNEDGMPQFLDAYLQEYCYNANKKFFPLETVANQLKLTDQWLTSDSKSVSQTIFNPTHDKMMEYYVKGDITALDKLMRINLALSPGMYDDFIVRRNKEMVKGLDTLVKKHALFCAVGAGHLAGESGIITLLRAKGYTLRKVNATFSETLLKEKAEIKSLKGYTYINDSIGINAVFPGKPMELSIWDNHQYLVYREMGQGNTYSMEIIPIDSNTSLAEHAEIYIASPNATNSQFMALDDGSEVYQGLSDTYPEGIHWVRIIQNDAYLVLLKAYGGNKFMHSNRPNLFFSKVWFD
jgi:uncharacterized protein YbaP (TraB family)